MDSKAVAPAKPSASVDRSSSKSSSGSASKSAKKSSSGTSKRSSSSQFNDTQFKKRSSSTSGQSVTAKPAKSMNGEHKSGSHNYKEPEAKRKKSDDARGKIVDGGPNEETDNGDRVAKPKTSSIECQTDPDFASFGTGACETIQKELVALKQQLANMRSYVTQLINTLDNGEVASPNDTAELRFKPRGG